MSRAKSVGGFMKAGKTCHLRAGGDPENKRLDSRFHGNDNSARNLPELHATKAAGHNQFSPMLFFIRGGFMLYLQLSLIIFILVRLYLLHKS